MPFIAVDLLLPQTCRVARLVNSRYFSGGSAFGFQSTADIQDWIILAGLIIVLGESPRRFRFRNVVGITPRTPSYTTGRYYSGGLDCPGRPVQVFG